MSNKKLFLLLSGLLVVGIVGGGTFFYLQNRSTGKNGPTTNSEGIEAQEKAQYLFKDRINFPLENFIVNLADSGGRRYLSTTIVLEFSDKRLVGSLEKKVPEIRDRILMILPTKTFKDIQSAEGKKTLRTTLIRELNDVLQEGKITNIYFQEFVVQ
ncbi:MAG: flagellar basal body-associated protein FliL [Desulfobacteraceae bacterium]